MKTNTRHLGDLTDSELRPTILIDSREQCPLVFQTLKSEVGCLTTGDYSVRGCEHIFGIERKSIPDLIQSVTSERERFERELHRLRGFWFSRLLVVGAEAEIETHRYRGNANPKSILHSLWTFEVRYRVPIIFEPFPDRAAKLIERWAYFFAREIVKQNYALMKQIDSASQSLIKHSIV